MEMLQAIRMMIGAGFLMAQNKAADDADTAADRINSREWNRAVRVTQSQRADALQQAGVQAGRIETQGSMLEGKQAVGYAAAGIDAASGTAADVGRTSRLYAELDAETTRNNARRAALGFDRTLGGLYDQAAKMKADRDARLAARGLNTAKELINLTPLGSGGGGGGMGALASAAAGMGG